ncbi:hypothetical protein [Nonomuraea sp. NPDC003709]|uniref:hypothetical protein n=1 Tax=Nonomuraea sp. NPDC003709 TaxID=3154450 RepID=UPI0033AA3AB7
MTEDGQPAMVVKLLAMDGNDSIMVKFNLEGAQHHLVPGMPAGGGPGLRHGQGRWDALLERDRRGPDQRGGGRPCRFGGR